MSEYRPAPDRYASMSYRRSGRSGLLLPAVSLGLWQNFGDDRPLDGQRAIVRRAFDLGVTHFDLANNYGPPYGSAEANFGRILRTDFSGSATSCHLDQGRLGHVARTLRRPWLAQVPAGQPGPEPAAPRRRLRRHLLSPPLDPRHRWRRRWAPSTPPSDRARRFTWRSRPTPTGGPPRPSPSCEASAPRCSSTSRRIRCSIAGSKRGCSTCSTTEGIGCIAFSPLAQGLLTDRYLHGIPEGSRARRNGSLTHEMVSEANLANVRALSAIAERRGQIPVNKIEKTGSEA